MSYRSIISLMPKTSVDADAQAFLTAAAITDPTISSSINKLVVDLKSAGVWSKMKAIYPMVGGTASTHKFNLKDPRDLDAAFRLQFFGGVTHSSTGLQGNGTNGYANTFLSPASSLTQNSTHISFYSRTNISANQVEIGALGTNSIERVTMSVSFSGNFSSDLYNFTTGRVAAANANSTGFYVASRINSTTHKAFKNNSQLGSTNTGASGNISLISNSIEVLRFNNAFYSTKQCAFSSIGDGLTDTEAANLYTAVQNFQTSLGRSVGTQTVSDADAQAFVTNAAIVDQVEANAVNKLVIDMKAAGVWTKMKAIYPMVGGTAATHKFNLKDPRDLDAAFRLVFNGGWTHSANGALPNGINAFANTFLNSQTNLTFNNKHLSFYSRLNTATGNKTDLGCFPSAFLPILTLSIKRTETAVNDRFVPLMYSFNSPDAINTANADSRGLFMASRTASNSFKGYKNGVQLGSTVTTNSQTSAPNLNIYIGAANANNSSSGFSDRECAFSSIGDGLTDTEAANLYTAVQNFQTTLNRQV